LSATGGATRCWPPRGTVLRVTWLQVTREPLAVVARIAQALALAERRNSGREPG
jgi:hypothetical protein